MLGFELDTPRGAVLAGLIGSGAALATALISQYGFGWIPCEMCLWQRYPYWLGLAAGALAIALWRGRAGGFAARAAAGAAALGFVVGAGLGALHSGVEFGWWAGPTACSGGMDLSGSTADVLERIRSAPVVRCDAREPFFLGLSMANWNLLTSSALAGLFGLAARGAALLPPVRHRLAS